MHCLCLQPWALVAIKSLSEGNRKMKQWLLVSTQSKQVLWDITHTFILGCCPWDIAPDWKYRCGPYSPEAGSYTVSPVLSYGMREQNYSWAEIQETLVSWHPGDLSAGSVSQPLQFPKPLSSLKTKQQQKNPKNIRDRRPPVFLFWARIRFINAFRNTYFMSSC